MVYAATQKYISLFSFLSKVEETSWEMRVELASCLGICLLQEEGYCKEIAFLSGNLYSSHPSRPESERKPIFLGYSL